MLVEPKGLSVTCHYRANPALGPQVTALAREVAAATGLVVRADRKSVELLPPVRTDKGTVIAKWAAPVGAACYLGDDDTGDLAAFHAPLPIGHPRDRHGTDRGAQRRGASGTPACCRRDRRRTRGPGRAAAGSGPTCSRRPLRTAYGMMPNSTTTRAWLDRGEVDLHGEQHASPATSRSRASSQPQTGRRPDTMKVSCAQAENRNGMATVTTVRSTRSVNHSAAARRPRVPQSPGHGTFAPLPRASPRGTREIRTMQSAPGQCTGSPDKLGRCYGRWIHD